MSEPEANESWFTMGYPEPVLLTSKQRSLLASYREVILDILVPEERVVVELMDFTEWLDSLSKYEASRLIERVKNIKVMADIHRRDGDSQVESMQHTLDDIRMTRPTWWDTGMSRDPVGVKKNDK